MKWTKSRGNTGAKTFKRVPGGTKASLAHGPIIRAALSLERYFYPGVQRAGALGVPHWGI